MTFDFQDMFDRMFQGEPAGLQQLREEQQALTDTVRQLEIEDLQILADDHKSAYGSMTGLFNALGRVEQERIVKAYVKAAKLFTHHKLPETTYYSENAPLLKELRDVFQAQLRGINKQLQHDAFNPAKQPDPEMAAALRELREDIAFLANTAALS